MIIALIVILIAMSAIFSGLNLGMFSLGLNDLERKIKLGNKKAEKIYAIRKNGNFLLCTLNFGNTAINAVVTTLMALAVTGDGWIAPAIASVSIFIFAEIMPQAIFSRHAFEVGAKTTWLVRIFMVIMWPVAKPMSMLLDFIFGKELRESYNKEELNAVLEEHVGESLNQEEQRRMAGAMGFSEKVAFDVMTPTTYLVKIESDTVLDKEVLDGIRAEHYSRVPVYDGDVDNIIGILYAKDLIGYDITLNETAKAKCKLTKPLCVHEDDKLSSLWKVLIKERIHMAFIYNAFGSLTGIVTLEDMMEELIGEEIMDESDTDADLRSKAIENNKKITIIKE